VLDACHAKAASSGIKTTWYAATRMLMATAKTHTSAIASPSPAQASHNDWNPHFFPYIPELKEHMAPEWLAAPFGRSSGDGQEGFPPR
jgi:hypothetical protein